MDRHPRPTSSISSASGPRQPDPWSLIPPLTAATVSLRWIRAYALLLLLTGALAWGQPGPLPQNAPDHPTGLTAISGPGIGEVTLTWTPAAGATAHWVWSVQYDGTDSQWHRVGDAHAVINGLEAGVEYSFAVIAGYAQDGGEIGWSNFSNWGRAVALAPPPPPELDAGGRLTAAPGPDVGEVSLRWTPDADAVVHWVWSVQPDGSDSRWHRVDAGSAVIGGLEVDVAYTFTVISGHIQPDDGPIRWSDFSNWAAAMPQPAPPPAVVVADAAKTIAAGGKHTCMLQFDGTAVCWGANGDADKGKLTRRPAYYSPPSPPATNTPAASPAPARQPAGAPTAAASPARRPASLPPSTPAAPTVAPCAMTERRYAGAATNTASWTRRPERSLPSLLAASTVAGYVMTGECNAGATTTTSSLPYRTACFTP